MLLINASGRKGYCYYLLSNLKVENDELISLCENNIKFCLGCNSCVKKLEKHCVLNDYITDLLYDKILNNRKIIIASPLYMSQISGQLKNLLDRLYPFYNHSLLNEQEIDLILLGHGTYLDNEEEINGIINYFKGVSEWMNFKFKFIDYIKTGEPKPNDNDYDILKEKIEQIKGQIGG